MKILHTSDWHLGAADGERSLSEDQKVFIDEICGVVQERKADAVILAGDVFDRSVASAEAIRLYDYAMTRLCGELHTAVLVIAGNHDSAERLSSCRDLLAGAGLYLRGTIDDAVTPVSVGDTDFYLLPWLTEEKVRSLFPERKEEVDSPEAAFGMMTEAMRGTFDPQKKHILAAHALITDSETSESDRAAVIGYASQVSAKVFDGFDYVALGHLHKPQNVTETIRYSGTPMPYSFGREEKQIKSVTLIDTEDMTQTVIPLNPLHRRTTLKGTLDELLHPACSDAEKEGFVRLEVADSYIGLEILSELRRVYPNLIEVSGKTFEGENPTVTLTMEELDRMEENPIGVFRYFCEEVTGESPDDRLLALFERAMKTVQEEDE